MLLEDIRQLLGLVTNPEADCGTADRVIDDRLARMEGRHARLG
jgi:hypothetical protein